MDRRKIIPNDHIFSNITSDISYILGFIVTDGFVDKGRKRFGIGLSYKDLSLLTKIRNILSPNSNIRIFNVKQYKCCELRITSNMMVDYLNSIGICSNKSGKEPLLLSVVPPQFHYDYLRGIIDGDGSITRYIRKRVVNNKEYLCKDYKLSIVSQSEPFLYDIKDNLCSKYGNIMKSNHGNWSTYQITNRKHIVEIGKKIYNDNVSLFLERKYSIYKEIVNDYNTRVLS